MGPVLNYTNPSAFLFSPNSSNLISSWAALHRRANSRRVSRTSFSAPANVSPAVSCRSRLHKLASFFERHQYSLDLLSASRGSLSLLVTSSDALPKIAEELKGLANVRWENHKALVCLVGEKVRRQPEIASQVFRALSDVDLRMICQGASERNISFLVAESQAEDLVRRLHRLFFQSRFDRYSISSASQPMCQAGGSWQ